MDQALSVLGVNMSVLAVVKASPFFLLIGVLAGLRLARPLERATLWARYRAHRAVRSASAWFDAFVRRPLRWRVALMQLRAVALLMRAMRPEFREAVWRWRQCGIPGETIPGPDKAPEVAD